MTDSEFARERARLLARRRMLKLGAGSAAGALFLGRSAGEASAKPPSPRFGPRIDRYATYDGQTTCKSSDQPGTVDLKNLILRAYPGTFDWGILRPCSSGGVSEHKEGRAWDWGVPGGAHDAAVEDLFRWLLKTDKWGNRHAMARRLGIMYIIHDKRTWRAYTSPPGWVSRDCDPNASYDDCHFDHVHFSMSWDGALRRTSWWHPETTFDQAGDPTGALGAGPEQAGGQPPAREDC